MEAPDAQTLALVLGAVLLFHSIIAALAVAVPGPVVKGCVLCLCFLLMMMISHPSLPQPRQVCVR